MAKAIPRIGSRRNGSIDPVERHHDPLWKKTICRDRAHFIEW